MEILATGKSTIPSVVANGLAICGRAWTGDAAATASRGRVICDTGATTLMIAFYASEVTGGVGTDWIGMIRHRAVRTIDAAAPAGSDPFVNAGEATNVHSEIQARLRHQPALQHDSRTCGDGPWTRWALVAVAATSCRIGGVDTLAKPGAPLVPSPASDAACSWVSAASSSAVRIAGTG